MTYPGPSPTRGKGGPRNDRTRIILDSGIKIPIPPGYVAPARSNERFDDSQSPDDEEEQDESGWCGHGGPAQDGENMSENENRAEDSHWANDSSWEGLAGRDVEMRERSVSHKAGSLSDSEPSGSDYESRRAEMESKRNRLRKRGKACSDTEQEDEEEDEELCDDVVEDSTPKRPTRNTRQYQSKRRRLQSSPSRPRIPAKTKGKGRAIPPHSPLRILANAKGKGRAISSHSPPRTLATSKGKGRPTEIHPEVKGYGHSSKGGEKDDGEDDSGDDGEDGDGQNPGKARGRWSKQAILEIDEFGKDVHQRAEAIARKYRKNTSDVLLNAGLGLKSVRKKENFSNQFRQWYSLKNPGNGRMCICISLSLSTLLISSSPVNLQQFTDEVREEYKKLWKGVNRDNMDETGDIMAPILAELQSMESQEGLQISPVVRMKSTLKQVQKFVSASKSILQQG
jgi:hypothetical protein